MIRTVETHSEDETAAVGRDLARQIEEGVIVLLHGDLGAGKTAFVRGLAQGLGVDPDEVSSPTFTLVQEYRGRLTLFHVDLYRLSGPEVPDLGLEELSQSGVLAVEWAALGVRVNAIGPGPVLKSIHQTEKDFAVDS